MRLLISNISHYSTATQVANLFIPFGQVQSSKIIRNTDSGRSEGSALIEIEHSAGLHAIRRLNNFRFMNRFIGVEECAF